MTNCTVSYRDESGIEHAVNVAAESLFEAAALGVEALRADKMNPCRPPTAAILEVTIQPPPVVHRVPMAQLRTWMQSHGKSPREVVIKSRLKESLER